MMNYAFILNIIFHIFLTTLVSCGLFVLYVWLYLLIYLCLCACFCILVYCICLGFSVGMYVGGGEGESLYTVPACNGNGCFFR